MKVAFIKFRRLQWTGHVIRMKEHQRKPCDKQFIVSEGLENPGNNGNTKAKRQKILGTMH
jgi:hypothetical protein